MFGLFKTETIYLRIFTNRVEVRSLEKDHTISRTAITPFSSERLLVAQYSAAVALIQEILEEMSGGKRLKAQLNVLIQPMEKTEGGLSEVEERALQDLGEHAGGKQVVIHLSQAMLSDTQIWELVAG
jgi:hypothetical protein